MSARVLVLGATGRTGGAVASALERRGATAVRAARDPSRVPGPAVALDLLDPETWAPALRGVDRAFVLWPPGTSPAKHVLPFLELGAQQGLKRVAFLSILGAERVGVLPHRQIEQHLLASGLGSVLLRSGYFMQNLSTTHAAMIRDLDQVSLPAGRGAISMVDVHDVADAAAVGLLERDDDVAWDLTGPVALDFSQVAAALSETLGRPIRFRSPLIPVFLWQEVQRGTPFGLAAFMVAEYTHARLGLADRVGQGVQDALGRSPTTFQEFAGRERAAWCAGYST